MKNKCADCHSAVSRKENKRCQPCYAKYLRANPEKFKTYRHGAIRCKRCANSGALNPQYSTGISTRPNYCMDCHKEIAWQNKRCGNCREKNLRKGSGNPNWKGGRSFLPYSSKFTEELKQRIIDRDNNICQLCSFTTKQHLRKFNCKLSIHHIDYNKDNCDESNLITLCLTCNGSVNTDRTYWIKYFTEKVQEKYERA